MTNSKKRAALRCIGLLLYLWRETGMVVMGMGKQSILRERRSLAYVFRGPHLLSVKREA